MHTTSRLVDTVVAHRDRAFGERTFHFRSHCQHASARLPARFVRPCGQRRCRFLSFLLSLVFLLFNYTPPTFPHLCVITSVDGTSVSKRPSRRAICDPSFMFRGVSLCIYTYIYVHSHMYMCVYMRADGEKGWSFDLSLYFSFFFFVDIC